MSWLRLMEESIKEDKPETPSDDALPVRPLPARKNHRFSALIKEMWPAYLIEIFVIMLGISITLALEEWRDHEKERQQAVVYLRNLEFDIQTDSTALHNAITGTRELLDNGNQLLGFIKSSDNKNIPFSQVNSDVRSILGRPNFLVSDATFSDLRTSGNLHLLKEADIKNSLFTYYNETQLIEEVQNAEQQAAIILAGSYFLKLFPLEKTTQPQWQSQDEKVSILKDVQFENNILLRVGNRIELLDLYQKADSTGYVLRQELRTKLQW